MDKGFSAINDLGSNDLLMRSKVTRRMARLLMRKANSRMEMSRSILSEIVTGVSKRCSGYSIFSRYHSYIVVHWFSSGRLEIRLENFFEIKTGRLTFVVKRPIYLLSSWWAHQDSNLGQSGYEPEALPTEL